MKWNSVTGQEDLKKHLLESITDNRVSHAQLFIGKEGYGVLPLALAYAEEILRREHPAAASRVEHLTHLDIHFSFPVYTQSGKAFSKDHWPLFREAVLENPYISMADWSEKLESENKTLFISVGEVEEWNKSFALKSFEGGTKILIVWNADRMKEDGANKLLKFLEEPPAKTLIIITASDDQGFLPTILSRTQIINIPRIQDDAIADYLKSHYSLTQERVSEIVFSAQGDLNEAKKQAESNHLSSEFEELFVQWVRDAFMVAKKPEHLHNIIFWARDIAAWNKEKQKRFLDFCAEMFRLALLQNYGSKDLIYKKINVQKFNWEKFSQYIHGANIESILTEITDADYHLQRNANSKIVWTDMGIKLSRYIHRKP